MTLLKTVTNDLSTFCFLCLRLGAAKSVCAQGKHTSKRHNNDASEIEAEIAEIIHTPYFIGILTRIRYHLMTTNLKQQFKQ